MSDSPRDPKPERYEMPTWVKVSLIIVVLLALGFIISALAGVRHGPGLHGGHMAPAQQVTP